MKNCIFITTFPRDYLLCTWAVRSLRKFLAGPYDIVVTHPQGTPAPDVEAVTRSAPEPNGQGFLTQMILKCEPDLYAPGYDNYMHWDSDCLLTRPTALLDFWPEDRPRVYCGSYSELFKHAPHLRLWQHAVAKCLGHTPPLEFMRCFPISFPARVYPSTRRRVELVTKRRFSDYVYSCRNEFPQTFAEFNTLGAWAWLEHPRDVDFKDWSNGPSWGWDRVHQYHGPAGPDFRAIAGAGAGQTMRETATRLGLI